MAAPAAARDLPSWCARRPRRRGAEAEYGTRERRSEAGKVGSRVARAVPRRREPGQPGREGTGCALVSLVIRFYSHIKHTQTYRKSSTSPRRTHSTPAARAARSLIAPSRTTSLDARTGTRPRTLSRWPFLRPSSLRRPSSGPDGTYRCSFRMPACRSLDSPHGPQPAVAWRPGCVVTCLVQHTAPAGRLCASREGGLPAACRHALSSHASWAGGSPRRPARACAARRNSCWPP